MTTETTATTDAARPRFNITWNSNKLITVGSVAFVFLCWEIFGRQVNPLFGSYPSAIAAEMWQMLQSGRLTKAFFQSTQTFAVGFLIAAALGIPLGMLLGRFPKVEAALGIYVTAGNAMPLIAITPLFMLWFGLGFNVKVAIIATLSFFPICMSTWDGVKSIPKTLIEVGESFVGSRRAILTKIVLPASVPSIMAGLRLAVGKGIIAMIVAEFFTALSGLGGIILTAANNYNTAQMFAPIIVLLTFAIVLNALVAWLERKIAPWHIQVTGRGH
ncbi:ABC transporter permease [Devosia sp. WQ 349]|uniref:ABC transporter permease n=1 Tax=Devosia sp. WQ 349K1 TaxID=2800329 RepID=UPI0019062735|nr:ABC transporter permease [Devosia sp. WQ 349K1]MBK1795495.1 ABC transporter permease [Devosia sp. WQ 349K1]